MYVGTAPGNSIYVQGMEYDAAGRVTRRTLGSANPMQTRYTYYPWNTLEDGGKLQQIYTTRGASILQNFQYSYDRNSNIETIQDYVMGDPQTATRPPRPSVHSQNPPSSFPPVRCTFLRALHLLPTLCCAAPLCLLVYFVYSLYFVYLPSRFYPLFIAPERPFCYTTPAP